MSGNKFLYVRKHVVTLIPVLLALVCLLSCGGSRISHDMAVADSLAEADQHAAVRYVDSVTNAGMDISRGDRMRLLLLKTKALNKLECPLDTDTLSALVKYFDRYGTPNEKMLANYIFGCYYKDNDNGNMTSEAMHYFQIAAEDADTLASDCDYRTLHKVHVQTAQMLMSQNAFTDAMEECNKAFRYALMAKDTFNAIITLEQRSKIYDDQGRNDEAFNIRYSLYGKNKKYGYNKEAARSLWPLIGMLVKRGRFSDAKRSIDIFEKESGLIDSNGNIEKGSESFYVDKGSYFVSINKLDSAEYYFRKCLHDTNYFINVCNSYIGLSNVYKKRNNSDSVAKYADLALIATDSIYREMNTTHLQQMRAMYDYSKYKESAEKSMKSANNSRLVIVIMAFFMIVMSINVIHIKKRKRRAHLMEVMKYEKDISEFEKTRQELSIANEKQQEKITQLVDEKNKVAEKQKAMEAVYRHNMQELEQSRDELYDLNKKQEEQFKNIIDEKDAQLKQLHDEKEKHDKAVAKVGYIKKYSNEPIVKQLKRQARKEFKPMTTEEINQLKAIFTDSEDFINLANIVTPKEFQVCMLVRTGFMPLDISILMGISPSNVSNIRHRLYIKQKGGKGSTKMLDDYINSL